VQEIPQVNGASHVNGEANRAIQPTLEDTILELRSLFPLLERLGIDIQPIILHTPDRINELIHLGVVIIGLTEFLELISEAHSRLDSYSDVLAVVDPVFAPLLFSVFAEVPLMFIIRLLRITRANEA
jgi:hypothetical protein